MKVAYLGPKGTFSEEAAKQYFEEDVKFYMYDTIPDVIDAVGEHGVDKAIVPLENTIEGTINMTIDSLLSFNNLYIEGEFTLPVSLQLLSNMETNLSEIKEVWSISPILTQCRKYIKKRNVKSLQYDSSASAALTLKNSGRMDVAVIGSRSLADILNLKIIDWNIQDNSDNQTRFIIISNNMNNESNLKKTMFVITPGQDQPGVLSSILNIFTALSINLSWIESRPTARKLGAYRFFLEANNFCNETSINKAIKILETLDHEVRILGRYNTFESKSHDTC
ncbi:prephenate dehydratase [Paenibacillus vini]|uniref:Prephenate dehydratase n=1 Tax=Paenibacillus vini TaxID=1476024 RepID=A0ABQ4MCB3_9BACL|nr:prephenate dehydratase [Paenibacillus vini]MDN4071307.1 prephenate dehydratase [Paenibacillus vini]GIP53615.1 prephenate dehydratase [Paenibacillus vini]